MKAARNMKLKACWIGKKARRVSVVARVEDVEDRREKYRNSECEEAVHAYL